MERSLALTLSHATTAAWLLAAVGLLLTAPALILAGVVGVIALVAIVFMPGVGAFALETAALAARPDGQLAASFPAFSAAAPSRPFAPGHRPPRALLAA